MNSYCKYENNRLVVGNTLIERAVDFSRGYPVNEYIKNKLTGHTFADNCTKAKSSSIAMFNVCGFEFTGASVKFREYESDNGGLSENHLCAEITYKNLAMKITQLFEIYDASPFITTTLSVIGCMSELSEVNTMSSPDGIEKSASDSAPVGSGIKLPAIDTLDCFALSSAHLKVCAISLYDKTDRNDCYVKRSNELIYDHKENLFDGSMFIIDEYQSGEGLLAVKEAPCVGSQFARKGCDLRIKSRTGGYVNICGSGISDGEVNNDGELTLYGATVGTGSPDELLRLYKRHYSKVFLGSGNLFAMSNTWGDRSRDAALCESFMLREGECAEQIGIDIMQIDDGWQKGLSANSAKKAGVVWSSGFYREDPQFWNVCPEKFPSGLSPLMSDKVELALWFSADGDDDYVNYRRDADRLASLSREYGVRQFKLDGMTLKSKLGEKRICDFMRIARENSGTDLTFNLDITAGVRLGYLVKKEIGTIFVENRYTDFINYYPHATLKNLWMLSHLFPARKFQFEILNNRRNADKYESVAPGDEFAPENYSIDWLFASVMVSNPLIWMEMQHLSEEQTELLKRIILIWKKERAKLYNADILPIGEKPDGIAFTGFQAIVSPDEGYLVLLRESSDEGAYTYSLDCSGKFNCEILQSSGGFRCGELNHNKVDVNFDDKRSYAFIRYNR